MKLRSPLGLALRLSWPVLLLCAAVLLPFLHKAFTIDDTLFLLQAQHLRVDPLHPTAFDVVWSDAPRRLSAIMPSGPIMAYLLLPSVMLGGAEWAAHLLQLVLLCIAVVATVALALRLGLGQREARRAGLFVAVTPAVLGMAATAMPDVAALAFGTLFMERFVTWETTRRRGPLCGSMVMLALSILTRSHLLLLSGVALLHTCQATYGDRLFASWRLVLRPPPRIFVPLGGGLLLTAGALLLTGDSAREASSIVGAAHELYRLQFFPSNLLAFFSHWALSLPLTLPWAVLRFSSLRLAAMKYIIPIFVSIIAVTTSPKTIWVAPIAALSALALYNIATDALARRDGLQVMLGAWILLALPVAIYIHMPPKYLIVSAPAMAILLSRRLSTQGARTPRLVRVIAVAGALLGVLIIRADSRLAEMGRTAAHALIAPRVLRGERVWFAGHWGFQFYAMQAGARSLTKSPPHPAPGDIVVASEQAEGQLIERFPRRRLIATYVDDAPGGRIMSKSDGAGFFSNGWGYLPFTLTFSHSEIERINVWQME